MSVPNGLKGPKPRLLHPTPSGNGQAPPPAPVPSLRPRPPRYRHGIREHRPCQWIEDLVRTIGPGPRWEILRMLADAPMTVKAIADALYLSVSTVSHHLREMEESCIVEWTRIKTSHIYRLTDRIRIARKGHAMQFAIATDKTRQDGQCDVTGWSVTSIVLAV